MSESSKQHNAHGVGHIVPYHVTILTCCALLFLTVVTVLSAKFDFGLLDLPEFNITLAFIIAGIKATLVCLFFMHLRWDRSINSFMLFISIALVVLFIVIALMDTGVNLENIQKGNTDEINSALSEIKDAI
tara:strand:+ start:163 stop:555 length:393 start_codon:yes stop_codon:yes gene_type:complete